MMITKHRGMDKRIFILLLFSLFCLFSAAQKTSQSEADTSVRSFANPPAVAKPWVFVWWFNGYVDKPSITQHLEALKSKGIGGFVLYNSESASIPQGAAFMSPEWRSLFRYTVKEAHRLGLQMGVNICYGWPAGGKWITPENNSWITLSSSQVVAGPKKWVGKLKEPLGKNDLYRDIVVQAIPLTAPIENNLKEITASCHPAELVHLSDRNYFTTWTAENSQDIPLSAEHPEWLQYAYNEPQSVNYIWIGGKAFDSPSLVEIQSSKDGIHFKTITTLHGDYLNQFCGDIPLTTAKYFRIQFIAGASSPQHIDIGELAIGLKPEVMRTMQLAAKEAQNNPMGVTMTHATDQLHMVWDPLKPLPTDRPVRKRNTLDITKYCTADGRINWQVPPGKWKILRIGETNTRVDAGGGLLVDYLSPGASNQHFNKFMKLLIDDAGPYAGETLKYFHEDNNEIHGPYNWTPDFIEQFKKLRGYNPVPYLSVFAGQLVGSAQQTDRFLHDYRRTIADLVARNHYGLLADSARKYDMGMQAEAGGAFLPFILCQDGLMNQGEIDIPAAEFWESSNWKESQSDPDGEMDHEWIEGAQNVDVKGAASAGHTYGKKIIAAESFTSLGPNAHWGAAPADLLLHSNIAFCEGINRLILHSSTTTKQKDGLPGYEYGAGTHFNQNVTWWKDAGPFFKFLERCSGMLQRGDFVADVLYYNGDGVPNVAPPKHIPADLGPGYDYDVCNTEVLLTRLAVKDGRLVLPDGMTYRLLVLPDTRSFNLNALRKIEQLVKAGAIITGTPPEKSVGLKAFTEKDREIKRIAARLWGKTNGTDRTFNKYGKGKVYYGKTAREILQLDKLPPDFTWQTENSHDLIDYIHRREKDMDIYFVANRRNSYAKVDCRFRVTGKQPEIWDPFSGNTRPANTFTQADGQISLPLTLSPYGSTFIVFRKGIQPNHQGSMQSNTPTFRSQKNLEGPYEVAFDTVCGGPANSEFDHLIDWSESNNDSIRYYSGTAKYSKTFEVSHVLPESGYKNLVLDLGDLKNTAHVWLNGQDLGILWKPPYRVDISHAVKQGGNQLEIAVTNLWVNRLIGDSRLPESERKTKTNMGFSPNTHLRPSGLLGPVSIGVYQYK